jgi:hypothetical protein
MYCMQFINFLLRDYDPKVTGVLRADDIPTVLGTAVCIYMQRLDPNRKEYSH